MRAALGSSAVAGETRSPPPGLMPNAGHEPRGRVEGITQRVGVGVQALNPLPLKFVSCQGGQRACGSSSSPRLRSPGALPMNPGGARKGSPGMLLLASRS